MSNVLIKNMEMPESCYDCLLQGSRGVCLVTGKEVESKQFDCRPEWCPLVPAVPLEGYQSMERTVNKLTQALAAAGTPVEEIDSDHIWYKSKQYISLGRVGELIGDIRNKYQPIKHGRWELKYHKLWGKVFPTCPVCGNPFFATNYCANCGTDMRSKLRVQPRANEEEQP